MIKRVLILLLMAMLAIVVAFDVGAAQPADTGEGFGHFTVFGGGRYNFASEKDGFALNAGIKTPFPIVDLGPVCVLTHGEIGSESWADVSTDFAAIFAIPPEILPSFMRGIPLYGGPLFGPGFDATKLSEDATWYFRGAAGIVLAGDVSPKSGIAFFYRYLWKLGPQGYYRDGNSLGLVAYLKI